MLADGGSGDFPEDLVGDLPEALVRLDQELAALALTHSGNHLHAALDRLLTWLRRLVRADGGAIYLRHGEILRLTVVQNDTLEREWGLHTLRSWLQDLALPIAANSIAGYVARTRDAVNVPDVDHIPAGAPYEFNPALDDPTYRYRSILAVPIEQEPAGVLGVLQLINALDEAGQPVAFGRGTEGLVRRYAVLAAYVIATRSDLSP
jgi:hypothetical protein